MAKRISRQAIEITGDTSQYESAMKRAERATTHFGGQTTKALGVLKKLGGVFTAVTGVYSIHATTRMIHDQWELMDTASKTASRLGLQVERLIEMRHAAGLAGIQVNTLEMALQRMTRRISEAGRGTGEAVKALQELNLNAQELARLSPDQQMELLADAISRVAIEGDQVRLAMKLFDSEGVALLNMLKGGSKVLKAAADDAQRLGLTFSQDAADGATKAIDATHRFTEAVDALKREMAIAAQPGFWARYIEEATELYVVANRGNRRVEESVRALGSQSEEVQRIWRSITAIQNDLQGKAGLWDWIFFGSRAGRMTGDQVREAEKQLRGLHLELRRLLTIERVIREGRERGESTNIFEFLPKNAEELKSAVQSLQQVFIGSNVGQDVTGAFGQIKTAVEGQGRELLAEWEIAAERIEELVKTPVERFKEEVEKLQRLRSFGFINEETQRRGENYYREIYLGSEPGWLQKLLNFFQPGSQIDAMIENLRGQNTSTSVGGSNIDTSVSGLLQLQRNAQANQDKTAERQRERQIALLEATKRAMETVAQNTKPNTGGGGSDLWGVLGF